jgi:hypothetical protein
MVTSKNCELAFNFFASSFQIKDAAVWNKISIKNIIYFSRKMCRNAQKMRI